MNASSLFKKFRTHGFRAQDAHRAATIMEEFQGLEGDDLVRLQSEPESENYFDVYGEPDTAREKKEIEAAIERNGCFVVSSEAKDENGEWQTVDSVGMCCGYNDPLSPFENPYIIDLMEAAIAEADQGDAEEVEA